MRYIKINKRHDINLCDTNVSLLSLSEAVARWTSDGQFMMTEVNHSDSYQSEGIEIPFDSYSHEIGKIEAALAGMNYVKEVQKSSSEPVSQASSKTESASTPAE